MKSHLIKHKHQVAKENLVLKKITASNKQLMRRRFDLLSFGFQWSSSRALQERQVTKHTEAYQISTFTLPLVLTVTSELFDYEIPNAQHCWGRRRRQSPPDTQRDRRIAIEAPPPIPLQGDWTLRLQTLIICQRNVWWKSTQRLRLTASLLCTWMPQIICRSQLGAHWDDIVIGTFLICPSVTVIGAKTQWPRNFVALGACFVPHLRKIRKIVRINWFIPCCHWRISRHSQFHAIKRWIIKPCVG